MTVHLAWEAPFTLQDFPITNYTVVVIDETSDEELASDVLGPDSLLYTLMVEIPFNLMFYVRAINSIGPSLPGTAQGESSLGKFRTYTVITASSEPGTSLHVWWHQMSLIQRFPSYRGRIYEKGLESEPACIHTMHFWWFHGHFTPLASGRRVWLSAHILLPQQLYPAAAHGHSAGNK
jgi:hypothetical protein